MTSPSSPRFLVHASPVGDVIIVATEEGVVTLHPFDGPLGAELERVALALRELPLPVESDAGPGVPAGAGGVAAGEAATVVAQAAAQQLDEYFDGERRDFDLPLDWRLVRGFTRAALEAVCDIPYGETAGYGEVAISAGSPRAARAVGTACATTPFSIVVPVHRVVRADGSLGEYGGRPDVKQYLIDLERAAG
ncbi:methylated-DNA--[protein]-cysteine S-methyltransferase [Microbacterium sp. Root180]|uniref:methylated-DNA--[protein]-cysteine S-methyltransferase n=1 Tax=Microbacterium sp. Root180 TaxID=1736483 RepID=UPI0006FEA4FF|nr:methylated-DNA--[protein]-cysteine S-methyltransferase [Microbacterium sp. Root180]KRB38940.1 cysteine methyltransferase [Microbacterium sp. Root180]